MMKKISLILVMLLLVSCGGKVQQAQTTETQQLEHVWTVSPKGYVSMVIYKFHDYEEGVMCYVGVGADVGGLSCLYLEAQ